MVMMYCKCISSLKKLKYLNLLKSKSEHFEKNFLQRKNSSVK